MLIRLSISSSVRVNKAEPLLIGGNGLGRRLPIAYPTKTFLSCVVASVLDTVTAGPIS